MSRRTVAGPPIRTCVGCRRRAPQDELVRVVRLTDGALAVDRTAPGRGAWLCAANLVHCAGLAGRRKAFSRAFRTPLDGAAVDELLRSFGS